MILTALQQQTKHIFSKKALRCLSLQNAFLFSQYKNLYEEHYSRSIDPDQREDFWREQSQLIDWFKQPETILDKSHENPGFWRWFTDGELNISYNLIDRHVKTQPNAPAIHYHSAVAHEEKTYTYSEVLDNVARFATVLKDMGIKKGDRVIIYMPQIPQALFAMYACSRIGAVHSVVFGGFSANELANRIKDSQASLVISASCGIEPGPRIIKYKDILDNAIEQSNYQGKTIIVQREVQKTDKMILNRDYDYEELMRNTTEYTDPVPMKGSDPHYILYTSGSTGVPKGIVRDQGGTSIVSSYSMKYIMNSHKNETYFAASDIGWVVGHTFIVYAPLIAGGATVLYEGKPVGTPDASMIWRLIEKYKVKNLFMAPTALRVMRQHDPTLQYINQFDISSLQCIHMGGEILDTKTAEWISKVPINNNYWQTETGWPITSNFLNLNWFDKIPFGAVGQPVPGYNIDLLDNDNKVITEKNTPGKICVKLPLPPSCMQTIWGNDQAFHDKYLEQCPGYYLTGDMGELKGEHNSIQIVTRIDDVINTAGHRLSTGQLEESLMLHSDIVEAAVVGQNDEVKGEIPVGFIVVKQDKEICQQQIEKECIKKVREIVGPVAAFKHCIIVNKLPKTRSGKVMRHILLKMINGKEIEKIPGTIEDESVLEQLKITIQNYKKLQKVTA